MKYFKVYAQNCKAAEPIKEIFPQDLDSNIEPLAQQVIGSDRFNNMDIDWDSSEQVQAAVQKIYEQAKTLLDKNEILSCGDYCIVKQDDVPQERPNMCGFDTELVLD